MPALPNFWPRRLQQRRQTWRRPPPSPDSQSRQRELKSHSQRILAMKSELNLYGLCSNLICASCHFNCLKLLALITSSLSILFLTYQGLSFHWTWTTQSTLPSLTMALRRPPRWSRSPTLRWTSLRPTERHSPSHARISLNKTSKDHKRKDLVIYPHWYWNNDIH